MNKPPSLHRRKPSFTERHIGTIYNLWFALVVLAIILGAFVILVEMAMLDQAAHQLAGGI